MTPFKLYLRAFSRAVRLASGSSDNFAIAGLSLSYENVARGFRHVKEDVYALPSTRFARQDS